MSFNEDKATVVGNGRLRVGLSDENWETIDELAERRSRSYEQDCTDSHRIGVAGELAVSKAYSGMELDTNTYRYGDGGVDLVHTNTPEGKPLEKIDVKARTNYDGWLIVTEETLRRANSDFFILVTVDDTFADLVGSASVEKLSRGKQGNGYGGRTRSLPQHSLSTLPGVRH